jgi:hypothetical protein
MHRGFWLIWIVPLVLCGCPKKDTPPETATADVQSPAPPAESNAPALAAPSGHPVLVTACEFINALTSGKYNRALALSIPGDITQQKLDGMNQALQWDQAVLTQAWADTEQAAVMASVPAKQGSATLTWAFNLVVLEDGRWYVRLADLMRSPQEVEDYTAAFQEVAPNATAIEIKKD